jgi:hypothetical protein
MKNRILWATALGCAAVLVAGGIFASNMGFKINMQLLGPQPNGSASGVSNGTQMIALPFNQQTDLINAEDVLQDVGVNATLISRYVRADDNFSFYTGSAGENFNLTPADSYLVTVTTDTGYIAVGSHDPSLNVLLNGPQPNGSASGMSNGTNGYSYPYHSVASTAEELIQEINAAHGSSAVTLVSRYVQADDNFSFYTGSAGENFNLIPGEGYLVTVTEDVSWVPAHY